MIIEYKSIQLFGKDTIIRAKAEGGHHILDQLENEACFYFVVEGTSSLHTFNSHLSINRSEGVVLQCGHYLGKFYATVPNEIVDIVIVKIDQEVVKKIFQEEIGSLFSTINDFPSFGVQKMNANPQLRQYVNSLIFYIENSDYALEELIVLKIKELILLLANSSEKDVIKRILESLYSPQQITINKVIENNLIGPLSIKEMAHICAMSLSTFQRKFKSAYNETPKRYLLRHRMTWAEESIRNTNVSITEISDKLGYSDISNFSLAFKKFHGFNPSEFQ